MSRRKMCLPREETGPISSTVLVVEDDLVLNALWQRYLSLMGSHCVSASRGEAALALAQEAEISAVILDIMLPGMDGWRVVSDGFSGSSPVLETLPSTQRVDPDPPRAAYLL